MNLNLTGKVFLVSGGAKGIGEAISKKIAEEKGIPIIIDPSREEGKSLVEHIRNQGGESYHICKRLDSYLICKDAVQESVDVYGHIDGIVNNAGINDGIGLENGSPQAFESSVSKNLLHYYNLVHYALPYLIKSKGNIVNICSKTAVTGQGNTSGYAAAKGAQLALTREWAVELLKYEIRVNAVIPAEVYTPLYQQWIKSFPNPAEKLAEIQNRIPLGQRFTTADEIADSVIFLLSEKASHITGQHYFIDGGYTHLDRAINS